VVLFGNTATDINLFRACCDSVAFGAQRSLLLYAVLLNRIEHTAHFPRQLRLLRNLIEDSTNEIRADRMADLIADVTRLTVNDDLEGVGSFNTSQRDDEISKRASLAAHPHLRRDAVRARGPPHLRGRIIAFDLDPDSFERRSRAWLGFGFQVRSTCSEVAETNGWTLR